MDLTSINFEPKHILFLAGALALVIVFVISKVADVIKSSQREQTRRELAAYVAEGSIDADQADRLLGLEQTEAEKKIADAVAWGMMSSSKAERLIRTLREHRGQPASAPHDQKAHA